MKGSAMVAVTSRSFSRHPTLRAELLSRYTNVTFNDEGKKFVGQELIEFLRGHERAIVSLDRLDDTVFTALPELRLVSKFGVGLDGIDTAAMARHRVRLALSPGVNRRSVAELVLAFALSLLRHIPQLSREVREGKWRQLKGRQLSDCRVGIIGFGAVGQDVARLLDAFGCEILACDVVDSPAFDAQSCVRRVGLDELLARSDIVTLHVPIGPGTYHLLDADRLASLKPGAVLINTARGGLVDEVALKAMLRDGRLAGAAFDVFETEPAEDQELLDLPNFLAAPHIGGSTEEAIVAMGLAAIGGLERGVVPE